MGDRRYPLALAPFKSEAICQACGGPNIVWFVANDLWNRVMPDEGGILCPVCFALAAERHGLATRWKVEPA
jgi:hypothetical protein